MKPLKVGDECPSCVIGTMLEKDSRYGYFLACNNFPNCAYKRTKEVQYRDGSSGWEV